MHAESSDDYMNADVFWRYYPEGRLFDGFAFGVKAAETVGYVPRIRLVNIGFRF